MTTVQSRIKLTLLILVTILNQLESVRVYSASSSKQLRHFTVKPTFGEIEYNFLEQPNKKQNLQNKPKFGSTNEKYEFSVSNYKHRTVYNSLGLPVNTETSFITGEYPDKPKYLRQFGDANLLNYKKKSKLLSKYPRNKEWRKSSPYYPRKPVFRKNAPYFKKYSKEPKWNPLPAPPIGGLSSMVSLDPTNGQPMIQLIPKTYLEHLELPEKFYFYQPNEIGNQNYNKVDNNKNHNVGGDEVKEKKNSLSREHLCAALRNQNQKDKTTNNSNGKTVKEAQPAGCGMSIEQFRRNSPVGSSSSGDKSYNGQDNGPDNRSDNRPDNRPDNRSDNRPDNRPTNRSNNRGSPFTPTTPAPEVVAQDDAQDELITDDTKDDDDQGEPATDDVEEETITTSPDDDNGTETSTAKSTDTDTNKKGAKPCTPCLQSHTSTPSYPYPYMSYQSPQQSGYPNSGGHYPLQQYPQQHTQRYSHPRPHPQHSQYHAYHHQPSNYPLPSNPPPQYASPSDQSFQYSPAQYPPGPSHPVPNPSTPYPFAPNPPTPYPPTPDPSASYPPVPYPHTRYPPAPDPSVTYPHAQYPPAPYPSVGHPTASYPSVPYPSVSYPPAPYPPAPYPPAAYPPAPNPQSPYPPYPASEMYPPQPTHSETQNVQVALSLVDT